MQRILLVDDDLSHVQRLTRALLDRGYRVVAVASAEAATAAAAQLQPDAVVLELKLPDASGLECLRSLRATRPHLRAIIVTAYGSIASAVEAVHRGARDYLSKPADADRILAALQRDPSRPSAETIGTPPSLDRLEWEHIQRVLADHGGNISRTAAALGIHRPSLQRKLVKFPPSERKPGGQGTARELRREARRHQRSTPRNGNPVKAAHPRKPPSVPGSPR
jgi:two-component system response regulator RegA